MNLIDKDAVVAEIERRRNYYKRNPLLINAEYCIDEDNAILNFLETFEVKEINTWHLQKNENIYDAVKDWSLHSFICLMDDESVQKFTGILSECYDGSVNTHIDATNDEYGVDNIVFWIEIPNL